MAANRIIAFKDEDKTFYVKGYKTFYDSELGKKVGEIDKTSVMSGAKFYTKNQEKLVVSSLELAGYNFYLVIKPKEIEYYTILRVSLESPSDFTFNGPKKDVTISYRMDKREKSLYSNIKYTHPKTNMKFENADDCLRSYDFKNRDDAKEFVERNHEQIWNVITGSIKTNINY